MKKLILTLIIALLFKPVCFPAGRDIIEKTGYTAQEKEQIAVLFKKAAQNGLSVELLSNKVKEAMMKKVAFNALNQVLEQRLDMMAQAASVIAEKKLAVKNRQYALQLITELQENGFKKDVYGKLMDAATAKGKSFDDVAKYFDVLGKYHFRDIAGEHYAEILAECITKNVSSARGDKMLYMLIEAKRGNMPLDAAKTIIMDGIAQNKRLDEIGDNIQFNEEMHRYLPGDAGGEREMQIERNRGFSQDNGRRPETIKNGRDR